MDHQDDNAEAVLTALKLRSQAVVAGDVAYLETILAPEFRHIHATGKIEPRSVYLGTFVPNQSRFSAVEPRDVTVNVYGEAAVISGDIYIERLVENERIGRTSRFVSVWRRSTALWQLAYWQMTAIQS